MNLYRTYLWYYNPRSEEGPRPGQGTSPLYFYNKSEVIGNLSDMVPYYVKVSRTNGLQYHVLRTQQWDRAVPVFYKTPCEGTTPVYLSWWAKGHHPELLAAIRAGTAKRRFA